MSLVPRKTLDIPLVSRPLIFDRVTAHFRVILSIIQRMRLNGNPVPLLAERTPTIRYTLRATLFPHASYKLKAYRVTRRHHESRVCTEEEDKSEN